MTYLQHIVLIVVEINNCKRIGAWLLRAFNVRRTYIYSFWRRLLQRAYFWS